MQRPSKTLFCSLFVYRNHPRKTSNPTRRLINRRRKQTIVNDNSVIFSIRLHCARLYFSMTRRTLSSPHVHLQSRARVHAIFTHHTHITITFDFSRSQFFPESVPRAHLYIYVRFSSRARAHSRVSQGNLISRGGANLKRGAHTMCVCVYPLLPTSRRVRGFSRKRAAAIYSDVVATAAAGCCICDGEKSAARDVSAL